MIKTVNNKEELINSLIDNLHAATFYYNQVDIWYNKRKSFNKWNFVAKLKHDISFINNMIKLCKEIKVVEIPIIMGANEDIIPIVKSAHLFKD